MNDVTIPREIAGPVEVADDLLRWTAGEAHELENLYRLLSHQTAQELMPRALWLTLLERVSAGLQAKAGGR